MKHIIACLLSLLVSTPMANAEQATPEEMLRWLNDESDSRIDDVNEGQLRFLDAEPARPPLHSINTLYITQQSIDDGWVQLRQCYRDLTPLPAAEVVYRYRQMRKLALSSYSNIGRARIVGQSVQLKNIGRDAELCIQAEVRIFYQNPDGSFSLVNGPFHRKFLDGYYPYRVSLEIRYPGERLRFVRSKPTSQTGFLVKRGKNLLKIDSLFEGILNTEIIFRGNKPH